MTISATQVDEFVAGPKEAFVWASRENLATSVDVRTKLERVVDRLVAALDDLNPSSFFNASPGTDARVLLSILRETPLSPPEVRKVLDGLARRGRLGEFLHVVREPEFRTYLKVKEVPWDYIVVHWEPSPGDSLQFLAGFIVGAGKEATEIVVLVGKIIGALFDEKLAEKVRTFWKSVRKLYDFIEREGIAAFVKQQYEQMIKQFDDALYERRFFEAGQMLGQFVVFIVPLLVALPTLAKTAGKLATRAASLVDDLLELTADMLKRMDIELQQLYEGMVGALGPQFALGGGAYGELIDGGRWIILSDGGVPFAKVSRRGFFEQISERRGSGGGGGRSSPSKDPLHDLTLEEKEEFFRSWIASKKLSKFGRFFAEEIEGLVVQAQVELYRHLKGKWLRQPYYGKSLHDFFRQLAETYFDGIKFRVLPEKKLADFAEIPDAVKNMTVRKFMKGKTKGLDKDFLDGKVGDKIPDLVVESDDVVFVWDLTSRASPAHQAKTWFYREVFKHSMPSKKIEVGETYYHYYSPNAKKWDQPGSGV